jgi:hypothetical protein
MDKKNCFKFRLFYIFKCASIELNIFYSIAQASLRTRLECF